MRKEKTICFKWNQFSMFGDRPGAVRFGGGSSKAYYPGPSAAETALEQEQVDLLKESAAQQAQLNPLLYEQAGLNYDPTTGAISKMTDAEYYASLTPTEQQQYDITNLANQREQQALEGTLPVPADVQEQLDKQQRMETQQLSNQLGPGYATSTPGMQAQELLNEQQASVLANVRQGEMTGAEAISSTSQSELDQAMQNYIAASESPIAGSENIVSGMTVPISEYASERSRQMQANQFNATQEQQANEARMQGISGGVNSVTSCCFIFLAADLGDKLLGYVIRYKGSHYAPESDVALGYKRLAIWIVPKMRKSRRIKSFVKFIMVNPMALYAKAYYEKDRLRQINLFPITLFWGLLFDMTGKLCGEKGWARYWKLAESW